MGLHDSDFLDSHLSEWEEVFKGATIVADEHFRRGGQQFRNVTWVTPYRENRHKEKVECIIDQS